MANAFDGVHWLGHASFMLTDRMSGNRIYYVDPHELKGNGYGKADIVFISHAHFDHCDNAAVSKLLKPGTVIAVPSGCRQELKVKAQFLDVVPNQSYDVNGFKFRTVPAYNNRADRLKFHPRENNWVGYVFSINGQAIYHAGDTDFIEEMKSLGKINVALLPIGGTYTMGVDEAIEAANAIKADITIPMHYRRLLGRDYAAAEEKFRQGVKHGRVVVLDQVA